MNKLTIENNNLSTRYEDANSKFKYVRNQIRQRNLLDILKNVVPIIRNTDYTNPTEYNGYLPWYLMLLIKLAFQYSGESSTQKPTNQNFIEKCVNGLSDMSPFSPYLPSGESANIFKFFRIMAFQQFFYQHSIGWFDIARLRVLFGHFQNNSKIQKAFQKKFKISLDEYIQLSFCFWTIINSNKKSFLFRKNSFLNHTRLPEEKVDCFLKTISLKIEDIKAYVNNHTQINDPRLIVYEQTPFIQYPLLEVESDTFLLYSFKVYMEHIQSFLFNWLVGENDQNLKQSFDKKFEDYINEALKFSGISYFNESELKIPTKKVDFLITQKTGNILVDAKAIDFNYQAKVNPTNDILQGKLKSSVLKGILQAYETLKGLKEKTAYPKLTNLKNNFVIIVTYRQVYLGHDFWEEFVQEYIEKELVKSGDSLEEFLTVIKPKNIFVISISEFDMLIRSVKDKRVDLISFLERVGKTNLNVADSKLLVSMHLEKAEYGDCDVPYLNDEWEALQCEITQLLKE